MAKINWSQNIKPQKAVDPTQELLAEMQEQIKALTARVTDLEKALSASKTKA